MKRCSKCKQEKALEEFGSNRAQADGKQTYCKICGKLRAKVYYRDNSERMRRQIYSARKGRLRVIRERIAQIKREHGCTFCPEREPVALDFHHRNQDKEFAIGRFRTATWAKVVREIQKCLLVCSNCHRKIHAKLLDDTRKSSDWSKTSLHSEVSQWS